MWERLVLSARAVALGKYPSSAAALITVWRVSSLMSEYPLRALETVDTDRPHAADRSRMVTCFMTSPSEDVWTADRNTGRENQILIVY